MLEEGGWSADEAEPVEHGGAYEGSIEVIIAAHGISELLCALGGASAVVSDLDITQLHAGEHDADGGIKAGVELLVEGLDLLSALQEGACALMNAAL